MRSTTIKTVSCAGKCGVQLSKVDEHAVGWRPLCNQCRQKGKSWWFDEYRPSLAHGDNCIGSVRLPNQNFGKNPEG